MPATPPPIPTALARAGSVVPIGLPAAIALLTCVAHAAAMVVAVRAQPDLAPWQMPTALLFALAGVAVLATPTLTHRHAASVAAWAVRHRERLLLGTVAGVGLVFSTVRVHGFLDERLYHEAALRIAAGGYAQFFRDYASIPWLGTQHPPLIPLLHGTAAAVGAGLLGLRLLSVAAAVGLVAATLAVGRRLDPAIAFPAAVLVACMPGVLRLGTTAGNDVQVSLLVTLTLLALVSGRALTAGGVAGLAVLTKYTALFMLPAAAAVGVLRLVRLPVREWLGGAAITTLLVLPWIAAAAALGVWSVQLETAQRYSDGFVASGSGWSRSYLIQNLLFILPRNIGVHLLPLLAVGVVGAVMRADRVDRLLLLWVAVFCVPLLLTLPDGRYFMPIFPAAAILAARGLHRYAAAHPGLLACAALFSVSALVLWA